MNTLYTLSLPPHIRPTKFPRYYIDNQGNAYREPLKRDIARKTPINEYGLIHLKPALRGNPRKKEYQYHCINVSLYDENGKFLEQIKASNHKLVAEAFLDNPDGHTEVDHKDRNKRNNSVENLRWLTHKENMDNAPLMTKTYTIIDTRTNKHWKGVNLNKWCRENCDWVYPRMRASTRRDPLMIHKGLHSARKKNMKWYGFICTY